MLGFENIPRAYHVSMDSIVDLVGQDFSQQIKRNFQYFVATTNLAMDYLTKFIKDGIVDNPLSQEANPMAITFPSPLRIRSRTAVHILSSNVDSRSFHKFYDVPSSPFHVSGEGIFRKFMCSNIFQMIYKFIFSKYYIVLTPFSICRRIHQCQNTWVQLDLIPQPYVEFS